MTRRATWIGSGLLACIVLASIPSEAAAQRNRPSWAEQERARIAGILIHTDITASITETRLEDAFQQISDALDIVIIGRYADDRDVTGLDADRLITVRVEDTPAYEVIERVLAMAEDYEAATWQIRNGFVEVGTKQRLSVPAAREVRVYDIADLLRIESYFHGDKPVFDGNVGESRSEEVRVEIATELFETILDTVEPEAWEPDQPIRSWDDLEALEVEEGAWPTGTRPYVPNRWQPDQRDLNVRGKWATMRIMRLDRLVVHAPDYIHRQIGGYPDAIRPQPDANEQSAPNGAASRGR